MTNTATEIDLGPTHVTLPIADQLLHSTIRIECVDAIGQKSSGTGFHFRFRIDDQWVPAIITNKHVLNGAKDIAFVLTLADDKGGRSDTHERIGISDLGPAWIPHPNQNVDLALLPIQPLLGHLHSLKKHPFYIDLAKEVIPSAEQFQQLSSVEEITMIGYPNGIWDDFNNRPIARRGITATACNRNYLGQEQFLVDAAVFPGSSGSPVFIFNQGAYSDGSGITLGGRLWFIGVIYAVHLHTALGQIETIVAPTSVQQMAFSQIPNNLGICIKASKVLEFEPAIRQRIAEQQSKARPSTGPNRLGA
jgi:hypothetical protein